jgi:hypothetical protein
MTGGRGDTGGGGVEVGNTIKNEGRVDRPLL